MKYHIEKNTVQETLIIPLYARKKCTEIFPSLYEDKTAADLINKIDYDFSKIKKCFYKSNASFWLFRSLYASK